MLQLVVWSVLTRRAGEMTRAVIYARQKPVTFHFRSIVSTVLREIYLEPGRRRREWRR